MKMTTDLQIRLQMHYAENGLGLGKDEFRCQHSQSCGASIANGISFLGHDHVGYGYERSSASIVVLSQDRGGNDMCAGITDLATRRAGIIAAAHDGAAANTHMRYTMDFVCAILDTDDRAAAADEIALLNSAKCVRRGSQMSMPWTAHQNCKDHIISEIEILRPSLVWVQGRHKGEIVERYRLVSLPSERIDIILNKLVATGELRQEIRGIIENAIMTRCWPRDRGEDGHTFEYWLWTVHPSARALAAFHRQYVEPVLIKVVRALLRKD